MKIVSLRNVALVGAVAALPAAALAQFNGIKINERVFNDFGGTTLTVTNSNSIPGTVTIDERGFSGSGWANRHDALVSSDGGSTAHVFSISDSFTVSARINLSVGSNSPRKEAGWRINSPITGDVLFLVNSDAGEIVAFGGGAPFRIFGSNGGGNGYVPGTTILMGMTYTPAVGQSSLANPGRIEYFIDRGNGIETSGPLNWSNLEGGPVNFTVGLYAQVSPANAGDFITAQFTDIQAVPEPATLIALGAGAVALMRRRRR
ncbi:MAG: PEP-CTERM sorting domain-containing protein [Fimbriimonadaceae bacterium]